MNEFHEWLKENKININGKYKGKRWGSVKRSEDGGWHIRICVQYDEYLEPLLSNDPPRCRSLSKCVQDTTAAEGV